MTIRPAARAATCLMLTAACAFGAGPGAADAARLDLPTINACVATAADLGKSPNGCVDTAQVPCLRVNTDTPAVAALCFEESRAEWAAAISARMTEISDRAPERISALAGIEVKYDLLSALVQCDRMEELALLREITPQEIQLQKTHCTAYASGLAYIRLLWRLPDPTPDTPPAPASAEETKP